MSEDLVSFEHGVVSRLVINRPKSLNALNSEVLKAIQSSLEQVSSSSEARVLVVEGAGDKAFVAGADISEMSPLDGTGIQSYIELGQNVMRSIECLDIPVIAAVQGFALGGGMELALACDLIVASDKSKFGQPEVKLGIIPGFGGTQRLLQRTSIGTTRKLVYLGEMISAAEAQQLGIVDCLYEDGSFMEEVKKLAESLAAQAPCAIKEAKTVIRGYADSLLEIGLKEEVAAFCRLFDTQDRQEGMAAFLEKRTANFTGK